MSGITQTLYQFLSHKWYFDVVYNQFVNQPLLVQSYRTIFALIDKGLLEAAGPTGFGNLIYRIGAFTTNLQTGKAYEYAQAIFLGLLFSLVFL